MSFSLFAKVEHTYKFSSKNSLLNITVYKDDEFIIEIDGKGWYANRYSRDKVSILLRIVDKDKTIFKIKTNNSGEAYIFFSLVGEDKYLHIVILERESLKKSVSNIEEKIVIDEGKKKEKVVNKASNVVSNSKAKENTLSKEPDKEQIVGISKVDLKRKKAKKIEQNENVESQKPEESYVKAKEKGKTEIYFIDNKNNKKVKIPLKNENKDYFEGIKSLKGKNYDKAVELLNDYLNNCERCKYREDAVYNIAKAYDEKGNKNEAIKLFKKIIVEIKGKYYVHALKWVANYYDKKGNYKEAINYYQKLFSETSNPVVKKRIADIAYNMGNVSVSLEAYKYCIEHNIIDDEIYYKLALLYDKPGKYRDIEKAYKYYHEIVEDYPNSKYFNFSKERVLFFEKNFINIK